MPEFSAWLQQSAPEQAVPRLWLEEKQLSPIGTAMYQLLVIQAFRPDRIIAAAALFVSAVMGPEFMAAAEREIDLGAIVEKEIKGLYPFNTRIRKCFFLLVNFSQCAGPVVFRARV